MSINRRRDAFPDLFSLSVDSSCCHARAWLVAHATKSWYPEDQPVFEGFQTVVQLADFVYALPSCWNSFGEQLHTRQQKCRSLARVTQKGQQRFPFPSSSAYSFCPIRQRPKAKTKSLGRSTSDENSCIIVVFDRRRLFTIFCVHKRFSLCANCLQWQHFVSLHSCRSFLCFWALLFLALTGLPEFINCRQLVVCCPLLDATYMGAHPPTYTPNCPGDLVHFFLLGITTI